MPAVQTSLANILAKTSMPNSVKRDLTTLFNGVVDDIEQLRAAVAALTAKLDTAGGSVAGLGTNYTSTVSVAKSAMNVKKS